jgi:hypothetical protein
MRWINPQTELTLLIRQFQNGEITMNYLKKLGLVTALWLMLLPAHAAMVGTAELLTTTPDRTQLINALQNQRVQQQLIELGVDPVAAIDRVNQMTEVEISRMQGKIDQLPAGAGLSTVELLLIILLIVLLI